MHHQAERAALPDRQESAYWLALVFHLKRERVKAKNGLVLTAHRQAGLGLLDLVRLDTEDLPDEVQRFAATHARLLAAEGRVSAQAFVVDALQDASITLLPITHERFPQHLVRRLSPGKAPTLLSVAGDLELLSTPGVAISGSRAAGPSGLSFAREMGRALAQAGITVVSGLARGIDTEAMEGALEAGGGVIGVAPEGILQSSTVRRPEVREGRLTVISEFAPSMKWARWTAMKRNYTIAGMSRALCIADCVSVGGTMEQFNVHRDLKLPVYIRRGPGEGRLMAELSVRPGAIPLHWTDGPIELPGTLLGQEPVQVECSLSRKDGEVHIIIRAHQDTPESELISALRDALQQSTAGKPLLVAEPPGLVYGHPAATARSQLQPTSIDPVVAALQAAPNQQATIAELSESVGWTKSKLRRRLKSLEEATDVRVAKRGRAHIYTLVQNQDGPEGDETSGVHPPTQALLPLAVN